MVVFVVVFACFVVLFMEFYCNFLKILTIVKIRKPLEDSGISVKTKGFRFGGGEGSRTPVRKPIQTDVSERRRSSTFPHTKAGRHAYVLSSR